MIAMNGAPITSGRQFNDRFDDAKGQDFDFTFLRAQEAKPLEIHVGLGSGPKFTEDERDPITWFLRGRGDGEQHLDRVIDDYTRAISLAPDFDLAYLYRGHAHFIQDETGAALSDYNEALRLNPASAETNRRLGELHAGQIFEDASVSRSYFERATSLDRCDHGFTVVNIDCAQDYLSFGVAIRFRTDWRGSVVAFRQAQEFYPLSPDPFYELAQSYELLGDKVQALANAHSYLDSPTSRRNDEYTVNMHKLIDRVVSGTR